MGEGVMGGAAMRKADKARWKPFGADTPAPQRRPALQELLVRVWWYIRQVSGDAAYENYLRAQRRHKHSTRCPSHTHLHHGQEPLTAREFYDDALRRRYSGISRCC